MKNILVIGGTGFLGRAILYELARRPATADFCLTVPTRRRDRNKELLVLPTVSLLQADVHNRATLVDMMAGHDAVISLVGILHDGEARRLPPSPLPEEGGDHGSPHGGSAATAGAALGRPGGRARLPPSPLPEEGGDHGSPHGGSAATAGAALGRPGGRARLPAGGREPYGKGFARVHVELPQKIAAAAKAAGVRRVLHVSALKAAAGAPSGYLRSKAAGETVLRNAGLDLTLFRPSVMFGAGDAFLMLFARLAKFAPFFPLASAKAKFQPVWVDDVAVAIVDSLLRPESIGAAYELCGPKQYTLRDLVRYAASTAGHPRLVVGLPERIAWLQAWAMEFLPGSPMTRDNLRSMRVDNVCEAGCTLPFGHVATTLEAIAPTYLRG